MLKTSRSADEPEIEDVARSEIDATTDNSDTPTKGSSDNFTPGEIEKSIMIEAKRTNENLEEIYAWIDQISFSRPRKNIARDFSDAVFMAELLKRYYPRHVDLHNYVSRSGTANKIDNWLTLNRKVLSKIGAKLSKGTIVRLANSEPGVVETVLGVLRTKILNDCNAERAALYFDYDDNRKSETLESVLNAEEVANQKVPKRAFVTLKNELEQKKNAIGTLNRRVAHLESLVRLKDQRIADLTAQIGGVERRPVLDEKKSPKGE